MVSVNPVDFKVEDGRVGYDRFRLMVGPTVGISTATEEIEQYVEEQGYTDETVYGTVEFRNEEYYEIRYDYPHKPE